MNTLDLLQSIIMLGAPMIVLSWFIFTWLFSSGEIDREANHKAITSRLKSMKKVVADNENQNANYVYEKWTWFGSGFYGLAGLWTFAVIEITQFFGFIFNFPGFEALFGDGIFSFLVSFFINQFGNVIQGFVWFFYWPADSIVIWVLVAYLGYWIGVELARRKYEFPIGDWKQHVTESTPVVKSSIATVVDEITTQIKNRYKAITAKIETEISAEVEKKSKTVKTESVDKTDSSKPD